jgi:hypothetical protein
MHSLFEGLWEHRFLYRNLNDLLSRNRQGLLDLEDTMRQVEESRRRQAASYGISLPGLLGF